MVGTDSVVCMGNSMQNRSPFGALPPNNSGFSHFDGEGTPFRGGECESYSQTSMGDKNNTPDMTRSRYGHVRILSESGTQAYSI